MSYTRLSLNEPDAYRSSLSNDEKESKYPFKEKSCAIILKLSLAFGVVASSFWTGLMIGQSHGHNPHSHFDQTTGRKILPPDPPRTSRLTKTQALPLEIQQVLSAGAAEPYKKQSTTPLVPGPDAPLWHQPPGPEVDKFWHQFSEPHVFLLTEADMRRMDRDPDHYVKIPGDWGYGDKRYLAKLDHLHDIHCLDMLRKHVHKDYYHPNMTEPGLMESLHVDHCIAALFDVLSCHTTFDVYNLVYREGAPWPQSQFDLTRQCRGLDPLWDFARQNSVLTDARIRYLIPQEGDYVHPREARESELAAQLSAHHMAQNKELGEAQRRKFHEAMREWKATGQIPRVEQIEKST